MRKRVAVLIEAIRGHDRHIMLGISRYARMRGDWIFYLDKEDPFYKDFGTTKLEIKKKLKDWKVDGIITRYPEAVKDKTLKNVPVVVVKEIQDTQIGWNQISIDNRLIGKMAGAYFLEKGFQSFGYCGLDEFFWSKVRGKGFRETVAASGGGISFYKQSMPLQDLSWQIEQDRMAQWITSLPKPVAILACNDDRAEHVIEACRFANINIPETAAILGVDDDELICDFSNPPLSSIALNSENAGYEAAEVLDLMMNNIDTQARKIIVLPTRVVTRQSTDILAIEDRDVAQAIAFIREHSNMEVDAEKVAEFIGLSLRVLQKRFKKTIGWSLRDELKRSRLSRITRMLLESNQTISQIAQVLGYASNHNMSRFFKKEMGFSPQAYRKQYRD